MKFFTTTSNISKRATDCVIVGIFNRGKLGASAIDIDAASNGYLRNRIKSGDLSGELGRVAVLTNVPGVKADRVVVVGLGKPGELKAVALRKAASSAARAISNTKARSVLSALSLEPVVDSSPYYRARHTVECINDALYRFEQMKSGRKTPAMPLQTVGFAIEKSGDAKKVIRGAEHAEGIAVGVALARDLVNLPANICTPSYLARVAKKLATGNGKLTTRVLSEAEMKKLGMGSLLSVTAGAGEPAKLIIMQYKGAGSSQPVVLVGKDYWGGLIDWMRDHMAAEGKIGLGDMDLVCLTDDPAEARDHILRRYRRRRAVLQGRLPSDWGPEL